MTIRWALAIVVALGFAACGYFMVWDWDKALLGVHNFRQTQTAISAYWMIRDGVTFDYQTPVLGKPWVIPFEAPFYQIIVVWVTELTSIDLDMAGRVVSVAFWLACLYPLLGILRWWIADRIVRWAVVLLVWSSPTYLYWSDAFMMESTAMFFSLLYIYGLVESLRRASLPWLAAATLFGTLASLQKATTFLIAAVPAALFVLLELYRRRGDGRLVRNLIGLAVAGLVPLVALELWTKHADALKLLNPLAKDFITSAALNKWNFGTWDQRVSGAVWQRIIGIESSWGMGRGSLGFLIPAVLPIPFAIWLGKHRIEIVILTLSSLTGALVFTNLFFIHEYYNYEGSIYLNLACALTVIDLVELIPIKFAVRKNRQAEADEKKAVARTAICCGVFVAVTGWGLLTYEMDFVPFIARLPTSAQVRQAMAPVAIAGSPQDVILIYGWDWNPLMPYYSGRKAIMDKETRPLDEPHVKASLELLAPDEHIAGMMVMGDMTNNTDLIHLNQAGALVHVYTDGSIHLNHGGTEMGQGLFTKVAQVVAEEFGVPIDFVRITATNTAKVPNASPTAASSGSDINGMAAQIGAREIKRRMVEFASAQWGVGAEDIVFRDGLVLVGNKSMSFGDLAKACRLNRVQLSAAGFYKTPTITWDRASATGRPFLYFAFGASCSEVVIDTLTGEMKVVRIDILHDVGSSLNPALDIGQVEGGFIQGMGWLTTEELVFDGKGRLATHAPATYKIPVASDVPADFRTTLHMRPNQADTIYRSKAVGEPPLMLPISVYCAILGAVQAIRPGSQPKLEAPCTPEAILNAIQSVSV